MFLPLRTDRRLQHTPWVNYTLIAVNVAVFLFTQTFLAETDQRQSSPLDRFLLDPQNLRLHQFISAMFLHAGFWHLAGNMLFLFVFGNGVEDRLGKIGYLAFYLAGGIVSFIGHAAVESAPALGASGAVCAVTGAYLALFPRSNVTVVYFFIFIGAFEIGSMWVILFQMAQNLVFYLAQRGEVARVAYAAHLAGYGLGFAVGMGLLGSRLLAREQYDLLALIERYRRRQQFAALTRQGYQPWDYAKPGDPPPATAAPAARRGTPPAAAPIDPAQQALFDLRARIAAALSSHVLPQAADLYVQLLERDPAQVFSQQQQLDLANQLMSEGRYDPAARAYELLLSTYGTYPQREQVQLILGLVYARYLGRRQRAGELLNTALPRLTDPGQRDLARQLLAEIG